VGQVVRVKGVHVTVVVLARAVAQYVEILHVQNVQNGRGELEG
jgi:hypothetical protein